jgi:hypothetical protein
MPFLASVSARQGGFVLGNISKLPTPTFTGVTSADGGWYFTIGNYDALNTYTISTTAGSVSRVGSTVTQSGVGFSTTTTISVTASRTGFLTSNTGSQAGTSNGCDPNCTFVGYTCDPGIPTLSYEYYQAQCPSQPCEGGYNPAYRSGVCGCC